MNYLGGPDIEIDEDGNEVTIGIRFDEDGNKIIIRPGDPLYYQPLPPQFPYAEDVTDEKPAIVIGETDRVQAVDEDRQLLTIIEDPDSGMKLYLHQYGEYKSLFKFLKPSGNANNPKDYTLNITLDNRVIPGELPDRIERFMYNQKFQGTFPPSYAEERHRVNTFKFTIGTYGNTLAEELNKELSNDVYNSDGYANVKIDGISVIKEANGYMMEFIRNKGVESKFIPVSVLKTFRANKAVTIYRPGFKRNIIIGSGGVILQGEAHTVVERRLANAMDVFGDLLNQIPISSRKQEEVDRVITQMYEGYNDINYSIYEGGFNQFRTYPYWVGNPELLDDVNKDLSDDKKFEKVIYCTEINDQNLFSQDIDLDDSDRLSTGKIYYFETESGKRFISERAGRLEVQDFDPNKLYNIIETIANSKESIYPYTIENIPDTIIRSRLDFLVSKKMRTRLYENIRKRFYADNVDGMNMQTFLQSTDNIINNDRIQRIQHGITMNNFSIFEKYILNLNNLYDFNTNDFNITRFTNLVDFEFEALSFDLQRAGFNFTFAANEGLLNELNYTNNDPIIDLKRQIYRFIIPNRDIGTPDTGGEIFYRLSFEDIENNFSTYSEELLDQFIESDPELKEVFNKIGNIRKIKLNDRDIYIDLDKKTFVGDFSTEGAKNILNYVEFEESNGEYRITNDYNIEGPDGSIFQFDTQYNRFGNDFYQIFPDIHIADNKIVYVSHNMNIESGFTFDIKNGEGVSYSDNESFKPNIDFNNTIENIYETDNNIIKEIIFNKSDQKPALHKISYIFNKSILRTDSFYEGKPQIEVIIENENFNGEFQQRGFFEGKEEILFNLNEVQNNYTSLIQNSNFNKASTRYNNSNTINKIKTSYLSAENINYVKIDKNFFRDYDITKEADNIIDLVNSNFAYDDKNQLKMEDVKEYLDQSLTTSSSSSNSSSSSSSSLILSIEDIEIDEQGDSIIGLKRKLFLNEYKLRITNLRYLNQMFTESFKLSKEHLKFDNNIKDLFLIGNLDEEELRMQYIRSPTKVANLYRDNYQIIFGTINYDRRNYIFERQYNEYLENKNAYELEITKAIMAQSSNREDTLRLSSFNEILGEQVFKNSEVIWTGNQRYNNILNISVCEFTPILIDENSGEVIYRKHYKNVDLDKELKDTNMNKRYVILDNKDGKYYEIYKSKDIENINNIWKILPFEIMQNRDRLFLEQLSGKMFSSSGNIFIDDFDEQKNTGYSDTQGEKLEKHRSAWNRMYNNSIIDSIEEFDIPTPTITDVNEYIDSFSDDPKRKKDFEIVQKFLLKQNSSTGILPTETIEENKLIIFGIDDEDIEMTPNIKNKQLKMTNGFFNWFVKKNNLKVGTGSNTIKEVKKKFSKKSLSEWKMSNEYNNLQINNKNKENILERKVKSYDNYNLIENIYYKLGYENVETFSDEQNILINDFFKEYTDIFARDWSQRQLELTEARVQVSRITTSLTAWYDDQIESETDEEKKNKLREEKKTRIKNLKERPIRKFQFDMIISLFKRVSQQYNLDSADFGEELLSESRPYSSGLMNKLSSLRTGYLAHNPMHRNMFEDFYTLKNSLGDRFRNMNYHEFEDELRNKLKIPISSNEKFELVDDLRFKNLKSYLETQYNLDEILDAAEFERIYREYTGVLLKIIEDNNLNLGDLSIDDPNPVPKLEEIIENRIPDSSLQDIVINSISREEKFYTVDRNNIQDGKYNMKENSLKDIIEKNYNKLRIGDYIIEGNKVKYGDSIDHMMVKSNSATVDISVFEELHIELKEKKVLLEEDLDDNTKKIITQRKNNAMIEFKIQQYNLYLPRQNSKRRLLNRLYQKFKKDSSDLNAQNILREIDELDNISGKYDIGLSRTDELDIQYRFNLAKKTINTNNSNNNMNVIENSIYDELRNANINKNKTKKLINQFFAVLYTQENVSDDEIRKTARIVFDKILNPIAIDNFNFDNIKNVLENENNFNGIINYIDKVNELEITYQRIDEIDSLKNQYNSIKFSNVADSEEIENYQNILNQEMEELEISEIAKNHNTNFYRTLDEKDKLFKNQIETILYETIVEGPSGNIRVFTREQHTETIKYIDWLNLKETQETIANNNGYIDPPVIDEGYDNWKGYYNNQSQKWRKVLDEDFISLDLFDWNEIEGEITATFNPNKTPQSIMSKARELLRQNKITKLNKYMNSNKKYLDNSRIQQNLPVGQPIKINGVYFMKIFGNNVIRNDPNLQNDTNQFLVKITEQQIREAQNNSIDIGNPINSRVLKKELEKKFNIKLNEKIINHIISKDILPNKLNIFNIHQINMILYDIKKNISKSDLRNERKELKDILETRGDYLTKEFEKMETVFNMLSAEDELDSNFRNSIEQQLIEQKIKPNKNLISKIFQHYQIEKDLLEERKYFNENDDPRIKGARKNFFTETYIPLIEEEYNILKDRTIANINEIDISVVDNTSIVKNFEDTSLKLEAQRTVFNLSRSNLRKTMTTILEDYANRYYPNNPEVEEFFKKDMWFKPQNLTKETILARWNMFKENNIAGINLEAPDPPLPHDYAANSISYFEQAYRQSSVYFDIASSYMNTRYGKAFQALGMLGLGGLGVFGFFQMTKEDQCNATIYDRETGERKKADTECNPLNIEEMTNFCERISNNAEEKTYIYDIKIGEKYQRRHTDEGEFLAQDPKRLCTGNDVSNTKLLKKKSICSQSCSEYNTLEIEEKREIVQQTCIERYNIPEGNHKLENIIRLTGKSLDELTNECSLETLLSKYVFGITENESQNI